MEKSELVGSVRKNGTENIKVYVQEYRGVIYIDTRVWLRGSNGNLEAMIATKKGLCLRPGVVKELLPILAEAQAKAEALKPEDPGKGGS